MTGIIDADISGEAFLRDFKVATDMAEEMATFDSWILAGKVRSMLTEQIRENPVIAEEQLSVGGIATLLGSQQEQNRVREIVEQSKELNLARFLGYQATVTAHERFSILRYPVANPIATGAKYLDGVKQFGKKSTASLTSLSPTNKSFRIGEFRNLKPWWHTAFWEIYPFNKETGESVVDIEFSEPKREMPSSEYIEWWNTNRA